MSVNQFSVAKALLDQLNTIESGTLPVVPQDGAPTDGSQYITEFVLPSDESPADLQTGSRQNGVYQVDVRTPKSNGKWQNLAVVGTVKGAFVQSQIYSHNGQDVKIRWISTSPMRAVGQYWVTSVSVNYVAFG